MERKSRIWAFGVVLGLLMSFCFLGNVFSQSSSDYVDSGMNYYRQGNYDQAIAEFTKAIQADPNNDVAYFNRNLAYRNRGIVNKDTADADRAIADLNKILELYPNHPKITDVYVARANAYHDKGDLDSALSDYQRAISADPNNALAYENSGLINFKKQNVSQSISDYSRSIELNPSKPSAYVQRGIVYFTKGDSDDLALADFNKAIQLDNNNAEAYAFRAGVYYYKQQYDKSWDDVHKAQSLGYNVMPELLQGLKEATGKSN